MRDLFRLDGEASPCWIWVLRQPDRFWASVAEPRDTGRLLLSLMPFIALAGALYGATLAGWRSPRLALYVAIKFPALLFGTTTLVMVFNWMIAMVLRVGLSLRQVVAITWGAMVGACWVLLGLIPVALFFVWSVAPEPNSQADPRLTHNLLLMTHIALIASAGLAGNRILLQGLRRLLARPKALLPLYWAWLGSFALVGCQLSWILRPFVGSPFYPVAFMRPDALDRNFFEFVFLEVIPYILLGGS